LSPGKIGTIRYISIGAGFRAWNGYFEIFRFKFVFAGEISQRDRGSFSMTIVKSQMENGKSTH
jgi:hypothetical protein